jgi:Restriction endonuclease
MPQSERRTWQEFEDVIESLHRKLHPSAVVKRNDFLLGRDSKKMRQLDLSLRYHLGPNQLLIVVEAKRHGRKIGIDEINAFAAKIKDVGANLGIMVAERGFTQGARNVAERENLKIYTLRDTQKAGWPGDIGVQIFVESTVLLVHGWGLINEHDQSVPVPNDEVLHLFEVNAPDKEVTIDDLLRKIWEMEGRREGDHNLSFNSHSKTPSGEIGDNCRFHIHFRAETQRFARQASLKLLGLTDASNDLTHTDAFTVVTQPASGATYYSERDFWKKVRAPFGIVFTVFSVVLAGDLSDSKKRQLISLLPHLRMEFGVTAGKKPISMRL